MATLFWLMRAAPEAQLVVREQRRGAGDPTPVPRHPLVTLVGRPNDYYAGEALWMATMLCWGIFGNAYWRIVPTRGGEPRELWWVPTWQIEPVGTPREFISHYRYTPAGIGTTAIDLPRDQVIHFRHGLDHENPRLGLSPIASVLREIMTDNESTDWIASLLRNMAVPGLIITPKGDDRLSPDEVERVKRYITSRFTGEHRGEPLAMGGPTDIQKISHNPNEMDMTLVHNTAEERVSAVLGVPAAVIGFGTGLENSKIGATMREFVGLAWSNGLIPPQRVMASELERNLLPRFETRLDRFTVGWDYSRVAALQEDEGTKLTRYDMGVRGGWVMVSEARAAMNLPIRPEDEVYLRTSSVTAIDPDDQLPPEPLPVPAPLRALPERTDDGEGEGQDEGEEETEEVAGYASGYEAKQGTLEEFITSQIGRHAGRLETIPAHLLRLADRQWRREQALQPGFQQELVRVLQRYGEAAATAAREVLAPKQNLQDVFSSGVIVERIPLMSIQADMEAVYTKMYTEMFGLTQELLIAALGVEPTDPERVQAHLSEFARQRAGMLDLPKQSRQSILRTLEDARVNGLTEDQMIDLIRDRVPAGRWSSIEERARAIARTESRYGANLATSAYAEQIGTNRVLVLDARLGPSDPACMERNGWIVTPEESRLLAGVEHTNGTLGFLPIAPGLLGTTAPVTPVDLPTPGSVADAEARLATLPSVTPTGRPSPRGTYVPMDSFMRQATDEQIRLTESLDALKPRNQSWEEFFSARSTVEILPIGQLRAIQPTLKRETLEEVLHFTGNPDATPAVVVELPDNVFGVFDGHHRIAGSILRGFRAIRLRVIRLS
jgi:HK97 family phage portal protein